MPSNIQALPETIAKAKEFTNIISALLNVIDELSMEIPEGKYIECMNLLKDLHGFKPNDNMTTIIHNIVNDNVIIRQQRNASRASPLQKKDKLTKHMTICKYCDTTITKSHLAEHQTTNKCLQIRKTKKLSAYTGKVQTSGIKQQVDKIKNFDKRFSATKCLSWWKYNMYPRENMIVCVIKSDSDSDSDSDSVTISMDSDSDDEKMGMDSDSDDEKMLKQIGLI
jgi:hypothetical protein|tara:strand:+ start:264 stop:935 length:672 start_codon:yes stop_codon:yes gene_type:complete